MSTFRLWRTLCVISVVVSAALNPGMAFGATYDVNACRLPNGSVAPANGWTATGPGAKLSMGCPGGSMTGEANDGAHSQGALHGFSFVAPAGTAIVGVDHTVEGVVTTERGGPPAWNWNYGYFGTKVGEDELLDIRIQCWNCGAFSESFDFPVDARLSRIVFGLMCDKYTSGACTANGSHFMMRRIALHLEDRIPPRVLASSGTLLDTTTSVRGERGLTLKLSDAGSGLYKARVEADGRLLSEHAIGDSRGTCKTPFVSPVPCSLAATVDLPVNTTRLSDGPHAISVRVLDATGSNAAVYGPIHVDVDNVVESAARTRISCPSDSQLRLAQRLRKTVVRYGGVNWLTGRISGPRSAMHGATVALVDSSGFQTRVPATRVGRHGRYKIRLHATAPSKVRPVVLSSSGQPQKCGKQFKLKVRAGVRFSVAPSHLRNGESIAMRGRLRALPVPSSGKSVAIQARARGQAWTGVSVVRTDPSGRFRFSYRFRRTFQRTTYEFRAVSTRERAYPYMRGWSAVRRAVVRP